jgi:hypothetical protein
MGLGTRSDGSRLLAIGEAERPAYQQLTGRDMSRDINLNVVPESAQSID